MTVGLQKDFFCAHLAAGVRGAADLEHGRGLLGGGQRVPRVRAVRRPRHKQLVAPGVQLQTAALLILQHLCARYAPSW